MNFNDRQAPRGAGAERPDALYTMKLQETLGGQHSPNGNGPLIIALNNRIGAEGGAKHAWKNAESLRVLMPRLRPDAQRKPLHGRKQRRLRDGCGRIVCGRKPLHGRKPGLLFVDNFDPTI